MKNLMNIVWYCIHVAFTGSLQALQSPDSVAQLSFIIATSYVIALCLISSNVTPALNEDCLAISCFLGKESLLLGHQH
jgi:hypothetical protein